MSWRANDQARCGFGTVTILRLERKYRQDGAVVDSHDGAMPHWVPLHMLSEIPAPREGE